MPVSLRIRAASLAQASLNYTGRPARFFPLLEAVPSIIGQPAVLPGTHTEPAGHLDPHRGQAAMIGKLLFDVISFRRDGERLRDPVGAVLLV